MERRAEGKEAEASTAQAASAAGSTGIQPYSPEGTQADSLQSSLQFERTQLLYSNLPTAIVISLLLAVILVYVQSPVIASSHLAGWLYVLCAALLGRAILFFLWKRLADFGGRTDAYRWLLWFRVGTIITGIVWGVGGLLLAPSGDTPHKIYVSFALAGLCAGGSTTLAIDRISIISFLLSVLIPQIVFLASEGDAVSVGMGAMDALFLLFLLASAWQLRLRLEENFVLRHKAIENEARLRQMLESSPIATRIVDAASNQIIFANKSYISLIESTTEQVIGTVPENYYAHPEEYADAMEQVHKGRRVTNKLIELHCPGKNTWTKWALASYFAVEYQNKPAILGWFYDITDRKVMEDRVEHMAYHDTLTELPNRDLFRDRLSQAIANAEREKSVLALMFVDLDKFKPVNDRHGHGVGDRLLKAVADRIRGCLRKTDSAARVGGDEFVILLQSVKAEENALKVAENIRHALNRPFNIDELTLDISSTTGIAIYPDHAGDAQQLLKRADIAMYYAKAEGRNRVKVFYPGMEEEKG